MVVTNIYIEIKCLTVGV